MPVKSPEEMQRLLATARKTPRPAYFSAVGLATVQISYEYETYLITLENASKRELVSRLRKALDQCEFGLDRDGMAVMAADFETRAAGAQKDELALQLGDYSSFNRKELQKNSFPETVQLVNDIGGAMGPKLFQRDQLENDIIAAGTLKSDIEGGSGQANKKKQIQSWIAVISAYITKA